MKQVEIKDVALNPDDYEGQEITVRGNAGIITIADEEGYQIRINYDKRLVGDFTLTGVYECGMLKINKAVRN